MATFAELYELFTQLPSPEAASKLANLVASDGTSYIGGSGGSSVVGAPVVRAFPFTHSTPNLVTGHQIYVPTPGDLLLDAWVALDTAFNGTTPKFDVQTDWTFGSGLFASFWGPVALDGTADAPGQISNTITAGTALPPLSMLVNVFNDLAPGSRLFVNAGDPNGVVTATAANDICFNTSNSQVYVATASGTGSWVSQGAHGSAQALFKFSTARNLPGKFTDATPLTIVVSQDGTPTGSDSGATQGAATLYLVTATPAT